MHVGTFTMLENPPNQQNRDPGSGDDPERSQDKKDASPAWLWPVFSFVAGVAVSFAMLSSSILTPDYQRGHKDGYQTGLKDKLWVVGDNEAYKQGFKDGQNYHKKYAH
jgi:hypothetical protein